MRLELSDLAEFDIQDIFVDGYGKYGQQDADTYIRNIYAKLNMLLSFPNIGHSRPDIPKNYQAIRVGKKHTAVYCLDLDTIYIARILYNHSDFAARQFP